MSEGFSGRDPFVGVQAEHALQEVYELSSVGLLGQHVRPLQVGGQVDLGKQGSPQSNTLHTETLTAEDSGEDAAYLHHVIQAVKDVLPGLLGLDAHLHLML